MRLKRAASTATGPGTNGFTVSCQNEAIDTIAALATNSYRGGLRWSCETKESSWLFAFCQRAPTDTHPRR